MSPIDRLLADLVVVRRYLAEIPGPPSNAGAALESARTGVVGDGCSVRVPRGHERAFRVVPRPIEDRRLWSDELVALPGHSLRVWLLSPAVLDLDARTVAPLVLPYSADSPRARLRHSLDLYEGIAWTWATDAQRSQWERAFRAGDSRPARVAMRSAGLARLTACAQEWAA